MYEDDIMSKKVLLEGVAKDAKGGAVLVTGDGIVYIKGLQSWNDDMLNKKITVEGILKEEQYLRVSTVNEKGEISQGVEGPQNDLVLYNMKIKKK